MFLLIESFGVLFLHGLLLGALCFSKSNNAWQIAQRFLAIYFAVASCLLVYILLFSGHVIDNGFFNLSALSMTILVLISFIGLIVLRYAHQNFLGDPDSKKFLKFYLLTLLAVCITVSANNLVLFFFAWVGISLSLHKLLLFYPERPRAALAAHKKFLFARLSEVFLFIAFAVLFFEHESLDIQYILNTYKDGSLLTNIDHFVAILLAAVALIKCAQLPLHGWLIQVVEAPTPVSALLHAGIINLGGFLLLLFSPLLSLAPVAQWLLLIVAGLSCVVSALVMMTRISIKVRLAWSTVTQMGLMLIECALGLYELALLHLIAHSCYKAHAFLSSGEAVNNYLGQAYIQENTLKLKHWLAASICVILTAMVAIFVGGMPQLFSPWILLSIAVMTMLVNHFSVSLGKQLIKPIALLVLGGIVYVSFSLIASKIIPVPVAAYPIFADLWVSALFLTLFVLFLRLNNGLAGQGQRRWFIALNAGFYLDEWATRITLRIWPIDLPTSTKKNLKHSNLTEKMLSAV